MFKKMPNASNLLYTMLVAVLFIGCKKGEKLPKIIERKIYTQADNGVVLPKGICVFYYKNYENDTFYTDTQEKCDCYQIGDTIE